MSAVELISIKYNLYLGSVCKTTKANVGSLKMFKCVLKFQKNIKETSDFKKCGREILSNEKKDFLYVYSQFGEIMSLLLAP